MLFQRYTPLKYYIIWCLLSGLFATVHLSVSSSIHPCAPEPNGWKETDGLASQPISDLHFFLLVNICALIGRQGRSCAILSGRLFLSVDARRRETNEVIIAEFSDVAWKKIWTYKLLNTNTQGMLFFARWFYGVKRNRVFIPVRFKPPKIDEETVRKARPPAQIVFVCLLITTTT